MNRNNIWINVCIAVVIITTAAVWGQLRRWQSKMPTVAPPIVKSVPPVAPKRTSGDRVAEVIVRFRSGVKLADIRKIAETNNDLVEDNVENIPGLVSIDDLDNADAKVVAAQYSKLTDVVEYAEPNYKISFDDRAFNPVDFGRVRLEDLAGPNDPMFAEQWGLANSGQEGGKPHADIDALKAWTKSKGSEKIVVAVLDTGVDYAHGDLAANMWFRPDNVPQYTDDELGTFNDEQGFNATDSIADPMDDNGHGTHCAGIIGAEGDNNEGIAGVNWRVSIMPLKFLSKGGFGSTKDAIEAINYAIDRKQKGVNIRIISASWGSTQYSKALEDAIRAAGEAGILFVAAAGNDGSSNDSRPHYPSNYDLPNVISVAALDRNDQLASFSNYGTKTVHIAAPGKDIPSTWLNDQYREASGTSMATPYVSGVAALMLSADPELTVAKLRERLLASVDKLDNLKDKVKSGGRVNAAKALGVN